MGMASSPSTAGEGGADNRMGSLNQQHDDHGDHAHDHDHDQTGFFSGGNFNDVDGDDDGAINNLRPDNGRPRFMDDGEDHESYSAEGEILDDLVGGHQGEGRQHLEDPQKGGLGDERGGVDVEEYDDDGDGGWPAMQTYSDDPPPMSGEKDTGSAEGGAGAGGGDGGGGGGGGGDGDGGGGIKRPFSRHHSPHRHDGAHRESSGVGGATDQEAGVDGGGGDGGGGGDRQRHSSAQETSFKLQQQQPPQRPGFLSGNRRPFRPGFREAHSDQGEEDSALSRGGCGGGGGGGGGGGDREESAASPSQFEPQVQHQSPSGASAFSESDAGDPSNDEHANPWNSKAGRGNTRKDAEGSNGQNVDPWNSKASGGDSREGGGGEDEGDQDEEGGAEGQAQKRQRQQRRKHSELLVGNGFSAIARCYAAANCAIRGVEADQRNMLEAETEIREDLVTFGVRVKEATHLMQMQLNAAFTEDCLGASGS